MREDRLDEIRKMYQEFGYAYRPTGETVGDLLSRIDSLTKQNEIMRGALECCARPGTYHLVGDVQEWGNYKAREALREAGGL